MMQAAKNGRSAVLKCIPRAGIRLSFVNWDENGPEFGTRKARPVRRAAPVQYLAFAAVQRQD
jgi:hypothetical protein